MTTSFSPHSDTRLLDPVSSVPLNDQSGLTRLQTIERQFSNLIALAMVLASVSMGLLMAVQVFLRYGLESPFLGIEELAPMLALWSYFMGMVLATREREHISGGLITLITRNPVLLLSIRLFGSVLCLGASLVFGYFAWKFASFNLELGTRSIYMRWPRYLWDLSMVAGFFMMAGYLLLQILAESSKLLSFILKRRAQNS